jgi:hypothetical protein
MSEGTTHEAGKSGDSENSPSNLLFTYLSDRQKQMSDDFNAMDQKFAQIIAYNGVILSVLILGINPLNAKHFNICLYGIAAIFISTILAGIVYCPKDYDDGLENFCKDWVKSSCTLKKGYRSCIVRWIQRLFSKDLKNKFPTYPPEKPYRPMCLNDCIKDGKSIVKFDDIEGYNKLLLNSIINNSNLNDDKAEWFGFVLFFLFIGIFLVLVGYYL